MTEKEIEMAMQGLFIGAARVRAHKYANKVSNNAHIQLKSRVAAQISNYRNKNLKAA